MKNKIYAGLILMALVIFTACDNGNTDIEIVDLPPTVSLGAVNGVVEGETMTLQVSAQDGTGDNNVISELASAQWTITGAGSGSGSTALTGQSAQFVITQDGLVAGTYNIVVSATDTNGNTGESSTDFEIVAAIPDITGAWVLNPADGSLGVGPAPLDVQWFSVSAADAAGVRACQYDDVWTFNADGSFTISYDANTYLEPWQPGGADACGTPAAPFDDGTFSYTFDGFTFTTTGIGAYLGLPKVTNNGELGNHLPADDYPESVTYTVSSVSETDMVLVIEPVPGVWWTYVYTKQ